MRCSRSYCTCHSPPSPPSSLCIYEEEAEKDENGDDNENEEPMRPPSSGRDASLMFKDLIFNTQALR